MRIIEKLPKTLVIDRSRWARGPRQNNQLLTVDKESPIDGCMCCLGFLARACKISKKAITNRPGPCALLNDGTAKIVPLITDDHGGMRPSRIARSLISANDTDMREADRETAVANDMASLGVTVTFIDGE